MSTIKSDALTPATGTNTDLDLSGKGSGKVDIAAGFKVGGTSGVPTASIQDDAITLAKLASGTDGELITWDASGDPATVAVGSSTHVLTSNGAGAAPTFQAAGGGRQTFISDSGAFSAVAAVDIALTGSYDTYVLEGYGLFVSSQGYEFSSLRVSDDSASSFETANYHYASVFFDASAGYDRTHSGSGINVVFSGGMDDAADQQSFFRWEIWRPKDTSSPTYFMGRTFMHNASANIGQSLTIGSYEVEGTAITHIRVFSHDGYNGTGDNIRLWGLSGS